MTQHFSTLALKKTRWQHDVTPRPYASQSCDCQLGVPSLLERDRKPDANKRPTDDVQLSCKHTLNVLTVVVVFRSSGLDLGNRNGDFFTGDRIALQCWRKGSVHRGTDYRIRTLEESVRRWTDCLPMLAKRFGPPVDGLLNKDARGIRPPVDRLPCNVCEKVRSTGGQITGQGCKRNPSAGGRTAFQCLRKGSVHRRMDCLTIFANRFGQPVDGLLNKDARGICPPVDGLPSNVGEKDISAKYEYSAKPHFPEIFSIPAWMCLGPDWPKRQHRCITGVRRDSLNRQSFRIIFITICDGSHVPTNQHEPLAHPKQPLTPIIHFHSERCAVWTTTRTTINCWPRERQIFIWDLNITAAPMSPGVAWNRQVQHIPASIFHHQTDRHPIADPLARAIQWHPVVAWCPRSDLVPEGFRVGRFQRQNTHYCWNQNSEEQNGEILSELATTNQWNFDVAWCPRKLALIAGSSFDGNVTVYSINGGAHAQVQMVNKIADSFPGVDSIEHEPVHPFAGQPQPICTI
ncbi:vesicle associated protein [Culex quinquefasciatus]|uniref:Vesicle associated protein n=1 Tax=Culex quinquefasciatus TaxID=7176 RepID=B0WD56_CULQU|nr:vesicle associated protein [Culex quinquefasciatus]|eukprot:XP_001846640.1 vesicle associated protein [Culex quinquefasciatus]